MLNVSTGREIEAAFATFMTEPAGALFVAGGRSFNTRRDQFATLAARQAMPTTHANREAAEAGGLMSYAPTSRTCSGGRRVDRTNSKGREGRPTCRSCSRPNSTSSSICKPPERWASRYPIGLQALADEVIE